MRAILWQRIRAASHGAAVRCACALTTVATLAALVVAPGALAAKSQRTIFDIGGAAFTASTAKRTQQLNELQAMGVDTVRILLPWRQIAPTPNASQKPFGFDAANPNSYPGEGFGPVDEIVRGANARGMDVLLTPSAPTPDWASAGGNSSLVNPDPDEFRKFVTALGVRYNGSFDPSTFGLDGFNQLPRVSFWSVWNEPNLTLFLKPQFEGNKSVSGRLYRKLFLAAQHGLEDSGHGADPLLIGETSPGPGREGTDPIRFLRGVFCLNSRFQRRDNCAPIDATGWAQHPYDPFDPPFRTSHGLINVNSIGRLAKALKRTAASGASQRRLPIFVTEYGVESVPDPEFGVGQKRQAEYIGIAEYMLWRNPLIRAFSQYLMQDDGGGLEFSFQTGLRFNNGAKKVAYDGFSLTLAARRRNERSGKVMIWGHVRPGSGPRAVEVLAKDSQGQAKHLRSLPSNADGYFELGTRFRRGREYRATARLDTGRVVKSSFTRVYNFR